MICLYFHVFLKEAPYCSPYLILFGISANLTTLLSPLFLFSSSLHPVLLTGICKFVNFLSSSSSLSLSLSLCCKSFDSPQLSVLHSIYFCTFRLLSSLLYNYNYYLSIFNCTASLPPIFCTLSLSLSLSSLLGCPLNLFIVTIVLGSHG